MSTLTPVTQAFADQSALNFVSGQSEHILGEVMNRAYPEITYMRDIPVDTSAPEWSSAVSFLSAGPVGQAAVIGGQGDDIPFANLTREKHSVGIQMAAIGYQFSLEEIGQAQMMGLDLSADGAAAARKAYEQFMDDLAYSGHPQVGNGEGLYSLSSISSSAAATSWASVSNGDAILDDVNTLLSGILEDSKGIETADNLHVPLSIFGLLARTRLSEHSDATLLSHIAATNIFTAMTGQALTIRGDRRLKDKVIAYRKDPDVLRLHLPMALKFLEPRAENLHVTVPGMFRTSGLEVRSPGAIRQLTSV